MKIVINNKYGGFNVSKEFMDYYDIPYEKILSNTFMPKDKISRKDKRLIEYIEKFGSEKASGICASLVVREIENGCLYKIIENDGLENIRIMEIDCDWEIANG